MLPKKQANEILETYKEKRKNQRFDIQVPANLAYKDGTQYNGKTVNLSLKGAFIQFPHASRLKHEGLYATV